MANPFYTPQPESGFQKAASFGLQFGQLRQNNERLALMREDRALQSRAEDRAGQQFLKEYGGPGETGLAHRRVGAAEDQNELAKKQFAAKQGLAGSKMDDMDFIKMSANLSMIDKEHKTSIEKAMIPVTNFMRDMADKGATRLEVYRAMKGGVWEKSKARVIESLKDSYTKALTDGDGRKASAIEELVKTFSSENFLDQAFPNAAYVVQTEAELLRIKGEAASKTGSSMKTWITPDNKVINIPSNQTPPAGSVPYSAGQEGNKDMLLGSKKAQGDLDTRIIDASDSLNRLRQIEDSFKPEYLVIDDRLSFAATGWKQKWKGTPIGSILGDAKKEDVAKAEGYWEWRQNSISNLNKEIKWLTGAAMNREEVPRLLKEVPNPGLGLFDGDAPSEFGTKLQNKIKQTKILVARYKIMRKGGNTPEQIKIMGDQNLLPSEKQIMKIINERGDELAKLGYPDDVVKARIQEEFFGSK